MSARDGLQPDVLWGQDRGAGGDRVLLAAALVPGDPGPGTGGDSVHHHHLHPEVTRAERSCFLSLNAYIRGTHFMLIDGWTLQWIFRGAAVLLCSETV